MADNFYNNLIMTVFKYYKHANKSDFTKYPNFRNFIDEFIR